MPLTKEQQHVVDYVKTIEHDETLLINAVAGSGKTTLLTAIVTEVPHTRGIYLAYNKSIATEASRKFPSTIATMTANALAYRNTVKALGLKVGLFNWRSIKEKISYENKLSYVDLIKTFCLSSYTCFEEFAKNRELTETQVKISKKYLEAMYTGAIECSHDFYMKMFHMLLAENQIVFPKQDFLLLDEAGDTNEVILEIVKLLPAKIKILVGDDCQNIYAFNHTINAFERMKGQGSYFGLTQSFRVSAQIADRIEQFCQAHIDPLMTFKGVQVLDSTIETKAFIARTNASLIATMLSLHGTNMPYRLLRTPEEIFKVPLMLAYVKYQGTITEPAYRHLQDDIDNWYEDPNLRQKYKSPLSYLQSLYDKDPVLCTAVRLVLKLGRSELIATFEKAKKRNSPNAKLCLGTAHSVKGLEFDEVVIGDDLNTVISSIFESAVGEFTADEIQELNLYYVACSRAKKSLVNAVHLPSSRC